MKIMFLRFLFAFVLFASAALLFADGFRSKVIGAGGSLFPITVPADRLLVIRNFTQDTVGSTTRGTVKVTTDMGTANVLTAAILDMSSGTPPEIINRVVIAGPATVMVTCGDGTGNCFVTYKKDNNN